MKKRAVMRNKKPKFQANKVCRKFKFGKRSIADLPVPKKGCKPVEYSDTVTTLHVVVYPSGKKIYVHRYTGLDGYRKCATLCECGVLSVQEARDMVLANKGLLLRGVDPGEKKALVEVPTLAEFCENEFLPYKAGINKASSVKEDVRKLTTVILPRLGQKKVSDISTRDISLVLQSVPSKSYNRYLSTFGSMIKLIIELGYRSDNPVKCISKRREVENRYPCPSDEDLLKFLEALKDSASPVGALALELMLALGLRRFEILSLKWSQIDLGKGCLFLDGAKVKNGASRTVVLNNSAVSIIQRLKKYRKDENPHLFPGLIKGGHLCDVRKVRVTAIKKAGIKPFATHSLRSVYISRLSRNGVPVQTIAKLVGHKNIKTTLGYIHFQEDELRAASACQNDLFAVGLPMLNKGEQLYGT